MASVFSVGTPKNLGFDYAVCAKSWMNRDIFFDRLLHFHIRVGTTTGRRALILLDNKICYGKLGELQKLQNVTVKYLSKWINSILQSLDLGIIASLKRSYE